MKLTEKQQKELVDAECEIILKEGAIHIKGIYDLCTYKPVNFCSRHENCVVFYYDDNCPVCLKIGAIKNLAQKAKDDS